MIIADYRRRTERPHSAKLQKELSQHWRKDRVDRKHDREQAGKEGRRANTKSKKARGAQEIKTKTPGEPGEGSSEQTPAEESRRQRLGDEGREEHQEPRKGKGGHTIVQRSYMEKTRTPQGEGEKAKKAVAKQEAQEFAKEYTQGKATQERERETDKEPGENGHRN